MLAHVSSFQLLPKESVHSCLCFGVGVIKQKLRHQPWWLLHLTRFTRNHQNSDLGSLMFSRTAEPAKHICRHFQTHLGPCHSKLVVTILGDVSHPRERLTSSLCDVLPQETNKQRAFQRRTRFTASGSRTSACQLKQYHHLSIYLRTYPPIYLPNTHLSICPSVYPSIHPSINPAIYLPIYLPIYLSIYLPIYPSIHPSIHIIIYVYIHMANML